MASRYPSTLAGNALERLLTMIKIFCDRCDQEIADSNEISAVVEDGVAKHYHKSDCFTEARDKLKSLNVKSKEPV